MALSCADGKNKSLSYQKRTPKEKSLKYCIKNTTSMCCVTHSKEDQHAPVNSGFTPFSNNSFYSNESPS